MKLMKKTKLALLVMLTTGAVACNEQAATTKTPSTEPMTMQIKEEAVSYTASDGATLKGWLAYDSANKDKRPVVLVVPEWWGLNDYAKSRAKQLAELGYVAMAVDFYGDGAQAANPEEAGKMAMPFYSNPAMAAARFNAALAKVKTVALADTNQVAAIGYCFGGAQVLNMARMGSPLKGVVSFHGNLIGVPADKNLLTAKILVCQGEADQFVPATEVAQFKKQMDSIAADYTFKSYANATHSFTNPEATEIGKKFSMPVSYNAAADTASWNDMKLFFAKIFK